MRKKIYNLSIEKALKKLNSSKTGLSEKEFLKRLERDGKNQLPQKETNSAWKIFLSQFKSPLVIIILVAMFFSFLIGHWLDAFFIVFVVLINAIVGFVQESKAEKVLSELSKSVKFYCQVVRNGERKEVLSEDIVVGDIVVVSEGSKIPADGRLIEADDLSVNESQLTGESKPIQKTVEVLQGENVSLAERKNMVFMGSVVDGGFGKFIVTATGEKTELGEISQFIKKEESPKTPLQKKFLRLSQRMAIYILLAIGVFATLYILRGESLYDVFITSIALVVSAVPEGLLPAITVVLVFAMRRLMRKKALVRRLNATESMGAVSVICTDKTGTLTKGEMQVSHIVTAENILFEKNKNDCSDCEMPKMQTQIKALEIAVLMNDAYVENRNDEFSDWVIRGRYTDVALLRAGLQAGIKKEDIEKNLKSLKKNPFNSSKKYSVSAYLTKQNKVIIFVLGAPEVVFGKASGLQLADEIISIDSKSGKMMKNVFRKLTTDGLRVLACAWKEIELSEFSSEKMDNHLTDLNFVGYIALKDPLRKDVKKSLMIAGKAGIKTVIITGDHRDTTKAIVNELGMKINDSEIIEGKEIDKISDEKLRKMVGENKIFARVSPEHKIRIVKAFQSRGEVVAMVGDGVNDAPALKASDVGISVGTGTDIAKDVADIVLLNNSFTVIIKAIEQGRLARENIRKVIMYLIADDFSELFLFFFAVFLGLPFPLYPIQILWINLIEDSFPNIALTTDDNTEGLMSEKPTRNEESVFGKSYKLFMLVVFIVTSLAASLLFYLSYKISGDMEKTRTLTFVLVAFDSLLFAYIVHSLRHSIFSLETFANKWLNYATLLSMIILLIGVYVPFFQNLLKTQYMNLTDWSIIVGIVVAEFIVLEFFKRKTIFRQ